MSLSYKEEDLNKSTNSLGDNILWGCFIREIIYYARSCSKCKCKFLDPDGGCLVDVYRYLT